MPDFNDRYCLEIFNRNSTHTHIYKSGTATESLCMLVAIKALNKTNA